MSFVDEASGFEKVYGIESASATVALVPTSVLQRLNKWDLSGDMTILTGKLQCGHMPST